MLEEDERKSPPPPPAAPPPPTTTPPWLEKGKMFEDEAREEEIKAFVSGNREEDEVADGVA